MTVLALPPGTTETEFFAVAGAGTTRRTAEEVVRLTVRTLDRRDPPPSVIAGRMNRLMAAASRLVTRRRVGLIIGSMMDRSLPGT